MRRNVLPRFPATWAEMPFMRSAVNWLILYFLFMSMLPSIPSQPPPNLAQLTNATFKQEA